MSGTGQSPTITSAAAAITGESKLFGAATAGSKQNLQQVGDALWRFQVEFGKRLGTLAEGRRRRALAYVLAPGSGSGRASRYYCRAGVLIAGGCFTVVGVSAALRLDFVVHRSHPDERGQDAAVAAGQTVELQHLREALLERG